MNDESLHKSRVEKQLLVVSHNYTYDRLSAWLVSEPPVVQHLRCRRPLVGVDGQHPSDRGPRARPATAPAARRTAARRWGSRPRYDAPQRPHVHHRAVPFAVGELLWRGVDLEQRAYPRLLVRLPRRGRPEVAQLAWAPHRTWRGRCRAWCRGGGAWRRRRRGRASPIERAVSSRGRESWRRVRCGILDDVAVAAARRRRDSSRPRGWRRAGQRAAGRRRTQTLSPLRRCSALNTTPSQPSSRTVSFRCHRTRLLLRLRFQRPSRVVVRAENQ